MKAALPKLSCLSLALFLVACTTGFEPASSGPEGAWTDLASTQTTDGIHWATFELTLSSGTSVSSSVAPLPLGANPWVQGPGMLSVTAGEAVLIELLLNEPERATLVPLDIPQGTSIEFFPDGLQLRWLPGNGDIGEHDLTFQVVSIDDPEEVFGFYEVVLSVIPQFGLIEYGF